MTNDRVHFLFVGDGHWRRRIEDRIGRSGLSGRFRLSGLVPPEEIPAVMHATDILVHCSLREGLARALPQAMLAGKPVISFDIDGAAEVVTPRTGLLLTPRDVGALAEGIEALAASPERRAQLGSAGRDLCRDMFDWRAMVEKIEALYRKLVTRSQ
jgi:glycosyltransferase involved in cell wall biosynthesis